VGNETANDPIQQPRLQIIRRRTLNKGRGKHEYVEFQKLLHSEKKMKTARGRRSGGAGKDNEWTKEFIQLKLVIPD